MATLEASATSSSSQRRRPLPSLYELQALLDKDGRNESRRTPESASHGDPESASPLPFKLFGLVLFPVLIFVLYLKPEQTLLKRYSSSIAATSSYQQKSVRRERPTDEKVASSSLETKQAVLQDSTNLTNDNNNVSSSSWERNETVVESTILTSDSNASASPLHDQTLNYSHTVHREWLSESPDDKSPPPAMLLLTTLGWNQPNQTAGLDIYRGKRTNELVEGVINHPWFHPTAWEDLNEGRMPISNNTRYYVFLDRDTCGEKNYPRYGHGPMVNRDEGGGRGMCCGSKIHMTREVMESNLMKNAAHATYVLFECGGNGPRIEFAYDRKNYPGQQIAFISLSAQQAQLIPRHDQGLPPPACRKYQLTTQERQDIDTCNETARPVLVSFAGRLRSTARQELVTLNDDKTVVIGAHQKAMEWTGIWQDVGGAFHRLAVVSSFSATPLGDNLFSYRFTEVMSCGSIPVVHADDWRLPFGDDLIDWDKVVVRIPQAMANRTVEILEAIPLEERCAMRKRVLEIYETYLATGEGTIRGIIENFELVANNGTIES